MDVTISPQGDMDPLHFTLGLDKSPSQMDAKKGETGGLSYPWVEQMGICLIQIPLNPVHHSD